MPNINQLAESHIKEHEARLKHIDELLEKADEASQALEDSSEVSEELANLKQERALLVDQLDEIQMSDMISDLSMGWCLQCHKKAHPTYQGSLLRAQRTVRAQALQDRSGLVGEPR